MKNFDEGSNTAQLAVPIDALDHVLGPAHGQPVVLEYGDFECPSCAQAFPAIKILIARFDNRLRFVFRHFPIAEFIRTRCWRRRLRKQLTWVSRSVPARSPDLSLAERAARDKRRRPDERIAFPPPLL